MRSAAVTMGSEMASDWDLHNVVQLLLVSMSMCHAENRVTEAKAKSKVHAIREVRMPVFNLYLTCLRLAICGGQVPLLVILASLFLSTSVLQPCR